MDQTFEEQIIREHNELVEYNQLKVVMILSLFNTLIIYVVLMYCFLPVLTIYNRKK
jgi:hypothetical protein